MDSTLRVKASLRDAAMPASGSRKAARSRAQVARATAACALLTAAWKAGL